MRNIYWSEEALLRPAFTDDAVWSRIFSNFLSAVGNPANEVDLSSALEEDLLRLTDMGVSDPTAYMALQFELLQAADFGSLAERAQSGSMGQGWSTLADIGLAIADNGAKQLTGLPDMFLLTALDATQTAAYAVSASLGKMLTQDGYLVDGASVSRPVFVPGQSESNGMTLSWTESGYELVNAQGDKFVFDTMGALLSVVSSAGENIAVIYNPEGQLLRYEGESGDFLEFTYDTSGRIASVLDGSGRNVTYDYSAEGSLVRTSSASVSTVFTYDADGNLLTAQRVDGPELAFTYDAQGRLESQSLGGGLLSENYAYDGAGGITVTNGAGEESFIRLNPQGKIETYEDGLGQSLDTAYDHETNTLIITAPDGTNTALDYCGCGYLKSITDANGNTVSFGYDSQTGEMIRFTDAGNTSRTFDYDAAGRMLNAHWSDGTSLGFTYDTDGDLSEFTNRRGDSVQYGHNAQGQLTSISDSASGALSYGYDARGNVISITSPEGVTSITYDASDRVTLIVYPDGKSLAYTYDGEGKRLSMTNQDGEGTFYTYDAAGRLETVGDDNGVLTAYAYDAAGRLASETNRNGTYTEYGYDGAGRLDEITNYDVSDTVTGYFQYTLDVAGRRTESITEKGTWTYEYDNVGQLTKAIFVSSVPEIINQSIEYQYDAAGNRTKVIENGVTTDYTANDLNQYETAGNKSFNHDDDGNLIAQTATGNNYSYVYDVDNRLTQITKPDGTVIEYEYNAFGNRSAIIEDGVRTEFLVDPFGYGNVVAEYAADGTKIASYTHGLGLASRAGTGGDLAFYEMDGTGNITALTDGTGAIANTYVYTPFGDELLETETILNSFEFNGAFGIMEDDDNLHFMRARIYDVEQGRFLSEDPLFMSGDPANLYRFAYNDSIHYVDPDGKLALFLVHAAFASIGCYAGFQFGRAVADIDLPPDDPRAQFRAVQDGLGSAAGDMANFAALPTMAAAVIDASIKTLKSVAKTQFLGAITVGALACGTGAFAFSEAFAADGGSGGGGGGDRRDEDGDGRADPPLPPKKPALPENPPDKQASPLVIDLDGDGVELHALGAYGSYFDLRGNGQAVLTGWVEPDDGLLALDVDGSGTIDDITELFGSMDTDGFKELAVHDANGDKVIDANDAVFADLLVWTDVNSDGISQASELHSLADFDIASINLNSTRLAKVQIAGNDITHTGTYTLGDGTVRTVVDAWFSYDVLQTRNADDYSFDIRTAFLPTIKGYGDLKNLYIAASLDNDETDPSSLMARLIDLSETISFTDAIGDFESVKAKVEGLLFRWAGIEDVDPAGRGAYVDGQHMAFYEAFRGYEFRQYGRPNPLPEAGEFTEAVYDYLLTFQTIQLLTQIDGTAIFEAPAYDLYTGATGGNMALLQSGIDAVQAEASAAADPGAVWARFAQFLGYTKGLSNLTVDEVTALNAAVLATGADGISNWQDVTNHMTVLFGQVIESSDDWGSFEIYYDNYTAGTNGDDILVDDNAGGYTNNEFVGRDGNDFIQGLDGHDKLVGGPGNDILEGGTGDDFLLGGTGDDVYLYESGNDTISEVSGGGYDELHIMASTGLTKTNLTDLYRHGDDLLLFLSTGDYIIIDRYEAGRIEKIKFLADGSEIDLDALLTAKFNGTPGVDRLDILGENFQTLIAYGYEGNDVIEAFNSKVEFYGGNGYDTLIGDFQNDKLYGEDGDDILLGAAGNDNLYGGDGDDWLNGGAGNDYMSGYNGNDHFFWDGGNDEIKEGNGFDTLTLEGLNPDDIHLDHIHSTYHHLIITNDTTQETIRVIEQFYSSDGKIDLFVFADGTMWSQQELKDQLIIKNTTAGNDYLRAFDDDNVLPSSAGNDTLIGQKGNDSYFWGAGAGNDVIHEEGGTDTLTLEGLNPDDVHLDNEHSTYHHLIITNNTTQETIRVTEQFYSISGKIELFVFADGTTWSQQDLKDQLIVKNTTAGDDYLRAFDDDNVLPSSAGDDILIGHNGNDSYFWGAGAGNDVIYEEGGTDTLTLEGLNPEDIHLDHEDSIYHHLIITNNTTQETLKVNQQFYSSNGKIDLFVFADGTTWSRQELQAQLIIKNTTAGDDYLRAFDDDNVLPSSAGDDILIGHNGNDSYFWGAGAGNDVIYEEGGTDTLTLEGLNPEDIHLDHEDSIYHHLIITNNTTQETLKVNQQFYSSNGKIDLFVFADGTTWSQQELQAQLIIKNTTAGDDDISGFSSDDTFLASAGNDRMDGSDGNDVFHWAAGAGNDTVIGYRGNDTVIFEEMSITDVSIDQESSDLVFTFHETGESLTVYRQFYSHSSNYVVENYVFEGGVSLSAAQISDFIHGGETFIGTSSSETLHGNHEANTISGLEGGDTIYGWNGSDTIDAGSGNDRLYGGADANTLIGGSGADTFVFEAATAFDLADWIQDFSLADMDVLDLSDVLAGFFDPLTDNISNFIRITDNGTDSLLAVDQDGGANNFQVIANLVGVTGLTDEAALVASGNLIVDDLKLVRGTAVDDTALLGTAGGDRIYGLEGADTISGLAGNDLLYGGAGDDILAGGSGADVLDGGEGIDTADYSAMTQAVKAQLLYSSTDEDGDGVNEEKLVSIENLIGTAFADVLWGNSLGNTLIGGAGNDEMRGYGGNDVFYAGDGDDQIYDVLGTGNSIYYGEAGSDVINTGSGTNIVYGGDGNDIVNGGSGSDTLYGEAGDDQLRGYGGNDTLIASTGNDFLGGGDGVDTADYSSYGTSIYADMRYNGVDKGRDGSTDDTLLGIENVIGTAFDDRLVGNDLANVFDGGAGNDRLEGQGGDDILIAGIGNDTLIGGTGIDTADYSAYGASIYADMRYNGVDKGRDGSTDDALIDVENVIGTAFDDRMVGNDLANVFDGGAGNDRLEGQGGDDILIAGTGNDTLIGGAGIDTADYSAYGASIYADMRYNGVDKGRDGSTDDALIDVENVIGTAFDDRLVGNDLANVLLGGAGDDRLEGRGGDDTLIGGLGNDTLEGGDGADLINGGDGSDMLYGQGGADIFLFEAASAFSFIDAVADFSLAQGDRIDLSDVLSDFYDPLTDLITDFVEITNDGTHSTLKVDQDGGADNFVTVASLYNVTGLTDEAALEAAGTLVTH